MAPTPEIPEWLVAQRAHKAATMRRLRASKAANGPAPLGHTCPPSELDHAFGALMQAYEVHACGNIAHMPLTVSWENDTWIVDLTIHVPRVCEYEVTGEGDTLAAALSNATRRLRFQSDLYKNSAKDAETFHLCY